MKKILILSLLIGGLSFGQDFFSGQAEKSDQEFFEDESNSTGETPGNPGSPKPEKVPLDDWLFLLPIGGLAVGGYYLTRKRKIA